MWKREKKRCFEGGGGGFAPEIRRLAEEAEGGWGGARRAGVDGVGTRGGHMCAGGGMGGGAAEGPWRWEDGCAPLQKRKGKISEELEDAGRRELLQAETGSGRARVRSCGGPGAGAWLSAIPADAGLGFSDEEFMIAARSRLGPHLCLGSQRCGDAYTTAREGRRVGDRCPGDRKSTRLNSSHW